MTPREIVLLVFSLLAGACVGSFVNVVIARMPLALEEPNEFGELWDTRPWREVVGGESRCPGCGTELGIGVMIPVVSWLLLRGRCRECSQPIEVFHPVVELAVPLLGLLAWVQLGADWRLLPVLWLVPVGIAVSVIDLQVFMVPTRIVWPAFFVSVVLCVIAAAAAGSWRSLVHAAIGVALFAGPLALLWFALPGGMGFGDVRLAVLLGWTMGFCYPGDSIARLVAFILLALTVAAVLGLVVGIVALGARGRKAKVPFGPSLCLAAFAFSVYADPIERFLRGG